MNLHLYKVQGQDARTRCNILSNLFLAYLFEWVLLLLAGGKAGVPSCPGSSWNWDPRRMITRIRIHCAIIRFLFLCFSYFLSFSLASPSHVYCSPPHQRGKKGSAKRERGKLPKYDPPPPIPSALTLFPLHRIHFSISLPPLPSR